MDVTRESLTSLAFNTLATLLIWVLQELLRRCNLPEQWHPTEVFSMRFSRDFSNELSVIHFDAPPVVPPQTPQPQTPQTATVATQTIDSMDPVPSPGTTTVATQTIDSTDPVPSPGKRKKTDSDH